MKQKLPGSRQVCPTQSPEAIRKHSDGSRLNLSRSRITLRYLVFFVVSALALLGPHHLMAQQIGAGTGAPTLDFEVANGPRQFTVTVLGGTLSSGNLNITLPSGYAYIAGSTTALGGLAITETSISGNTASLAISAIPATGTNATFTYKAIATCAAIGVAANQASYVFTPTSGSVQPEKLSNSFNLKNAKINITNLANVPATAGMVGDTYTRTYRINNNGFGNIDTVYVSDVSGNGAAHLGQSVSSTSTGETVTVSLVSSTTSGTNTTYLYRFIVSNTAQDNHLGQNEYFSFTQNLQIASCSNVNTSLNAWYGTGPNPQPCFPQNDTQTTALAIDNSKQPLLVVTPVTTTFPKCRGIAITQEFKVVNTGTAAAKDLLLRMFHFNGQLSSLPGNATGFVKNNQIGYIPGSFKYKIGVAGTYTSVPLGAASGISLNNQVNYTAASCLNTTAPDRLDLIVPDLLPGQEIYFQYQEINCCYTECLPGIAPTSAVRNSYKNACGIEIANTLASGNAVQLRTITSESLDINEDFPTDMVPGQQYTLKFETTSFGGSSGIQTAGSTFRYQITLPAGLVYSAPNLIKLKTPGGIIITPTTIVQTGQVLDITFTITGGGGFPLNKALLTIENITLNCSGSPLNAASINTKVFFRNSGCTTCEQQVYCSDTPTTLHCPGPCPNPGMLNSNFTVLRTTFGLPDSDNNGQPDGAGLSANVRNTWVSRGDILEFTYLGKVKDDGTSPVNFKYGYAKFTFPPAIGANFSAVTADVLITDATGTIIKVNKTGIAFTFTPAGASGIVDISIDKLATAGYPEFANGDIVTVKAHLKVSNGIPGMLNATTVSTDFYLSNAANLAGTAVDKWSCDNFSGMFTLVGMQYYALNGQTYSGNECNNITSSGTLGFVVGRDINNGGPGVNYYTDEYRQFAVPDNLYYTVPTGYSLVQFNITYFRGVANYQSGSNTITAVVPEAIVGNENRYNLRKLFSDQGGTWQLPDEGFYVNFSAILRPTCESPANTTDAFRMEVIPGPTYLETLPPGSTITQFTPHSANTINLTKSNIVVNAATPIVTTTGNMVTWEVQVANTQPGTSPTVWMGKNTSPANGVTISSVQQITAYGGTTVGSALPATNGIYQLGAYGQESRYYRVTASFTNCGQDVIPLAVGYVCGTYPASVDAAACKNITNLTVIPTDADLQVSLVSQPSAGTHDLCEELEYTAEVKNPAQGTAYNLTFTVAKPAGVAYIANSFAISPTLLPTSASFTTVNNDATYVSQTATTITFTIPASAVANLPYNQGYTIRYRVNTVACDFVSGTKMKVLASGKNGCGSAINGTQQQTQTIRIKGENANPNSYTITSSVSAPVNACSPADLVYTFSAKNQGPVATYAGETIRIVIPKPYTLGTVTGISNFTSGASPVITNTATTTTYVWTMPTGVAVNQNISFSAPLTAPASDISSLSCTTLPILEQVNYTFESTCLTSGVTCSGSLQAEGENTGTGIIINKPALNITGFTAATPTATNTLEGTVTVANTNGVTTGLPQAANITVYHDSNNNGVLDAADVQIGTKAITVTTATPQVFNYSFTTTYSGNLCPALVVLDLACACQNPVVYAYSCNTPLPVTLQSFELHQAEKGVLLTWATTTEANSDHFEIQHSMDAKNWSDIGKVAAAGESALTNKYSFTDVDAVNGLNYYRLKMVDKDNTYGFSRINSIKMDSGTGIVYPNPATESITLGIDNLKSVSSLEIFDTKGTRVLKTSKLVSNKINIEKLATGIYLIKITQTSGAVIVQKIVKQ